MKTYTDLLFEYAKQTVKPYIDLVFEYAKQTVKPYGEEKVLEVQSWRH